MRERQSWRTRKSGYPGGDNLGLAVVVLALAVVTLAMLIFNLNQRSYSVGVLVRDGCHGSNVLSPAVVDLNEDNCCVGDSKAGRLIGDVVDLTVSDLGQGRGSRHTRKEPTRRRPCSEPGCL